MKKSIVRIGAIVVACAALYIAFAALRNTPMVFHLLGKKTVEDRLAECGPAARAALEPLLKRESVQYPPKYVTLVCLKQERRIELWCSNESGPQRHIKDYPIVSLSGKQGPKLARGDMQVPEGIYRVESLNPNSLFHLSLRLNYPNDFDRRKGREDKRSDLGDDIMIHGGAASIGCLAVGDAAIEELFAVVAETDLKNVTVLMCPMDFRTGSPVLAADAPRWTADLYADIEARLKALS